MKEQQTPGPWRCVTNQTGEVIERIVGDEYRTVCSFLTKVRNSIPPDQINANARLIAAAPELLEALVRYVEIDKSEGCTDNNLYRSAVAAIAKATGEQP